MGHDHELESMRRLPRHAEVETTKEERDAQVLARLGKNSVLEVEWTSPNLERLSSPEDSVGLDLYQYLGLLAQFWSPGKDLWCNQNQTSYLLEALIVIQSFR